MGVSLALVFHLASALFACGLGWWGLRLQRDIRFMRQMVVWAQADLSVKPASRVACTAPALIRRMARVAGVLVAGKLAEEKGFPVVGVDPRPLAQIFLRYPVSLVQFSHSTVTILIQSEKDVGRPDAGQLKASVAGSVSFEVSFSGSTT
ncbi:MAG: hypothetical protein RIQ81_513 [Pseudomonadota bacterium]|jgi:hypothetical protein